MGTNKCSQGMAIKQVPLIVILILVALFTFQSTVSFANDKEEATQLVDKARFTLESFISDSKMEAFCDLIKKAQAILIAPQVLKGAFVVGASGGTGVLLVKDEKTGRWSRPAFYTIGEASFGFQIGGQASEMILLAMTKRGVTAFLGNSLKLGADLGVAAGPIGGRRCGSNRQSQRRYSKLLSF